MDDAIRELAGAPGELVPVTEMPFNAETNRYSLLEPVTPNAAFFVRSHFEVPALDPATWRLRVGGAVEREVVLSLDELSGLSRETLTVTLECAGNARCCFDPLPPGTPWGRGAVSTAQFSGVRLDHVLERVGVREAAVELLFVGADWGRSRNADSEPYARSLSCGASGSDTLLAWEMNGDPLTPEHGWPLRLVVPGWYGMASVKWLQEIRALTTPFEGFFQREDYVFRDCQGVSDGTPVTRIAVNSLILDPAPRAELSRGPVDLKGIAWSGGGTVDRVEVSADGGVHWMPATLAETSSKYAHRAWSLRWTFEHIGRFELRVRATDTSGATQPEQAPWNSLGYVNNSVQVIEIHVV